MESFKGQSILQYASMVQCSFVVVLIMLYRKTQVGSIDIVQIRPPRFIGRDGVVRPFSPAKAIGNAILVVSMTHAMYMQSIITVSKYYHCIKVLFYREPMRESMWSLTVILAMLKSHRSPLNS